MWRVASSLWLVAGVLKEKEIKAELWKEIEESLGLLNIGSLEESMSIIGFSYRNLPHQLKSCFLYFGGLLKGKDIHVSKLTQLWIAEGFRWAREETHGVENMSLLHTCCISSAWKSLNKRISFSRSMGRGKRSIHGGTVNMCKPHLMDDTFPEKSKEYRLFVHSSEDQIDLWQPSRSNVRSLLFNVIDSDNLLLPRDISFIFNSFILVKVLDLESFNIGGTFPSEIQFIIHLKYFASRTGGNSIPSSIAKL
ncbi:hypothetical protein HAX54_032736 [Datura stramonium]|uniref:Uncharacterized protein n=1 Tax=Datura stramonium TaxID=4076 RepID=A0ABS8SCS8_DATST|nr:hypothetical protein [Datura stramonium]